MDPALAQRFARYDEWLNQAEDHIGSWFTAAIIADPSDPVKPRDLNSILLALRRVIAERRALQSWIEAEKRADSAKPHVFDEATFARLMEFAIQDEIGRATYNERMAAMSKAIYDPLFDRAPDCADREDADAGDEEEFVDPMTDYFPAAPERAPVDAIPKRALDQSFHELSPCGPSSPSRPCEATATAAETDLTAKSDPPALNPKAPQGQSLELNQLSLGLSQCGPFSPSRPCETATTGGETQLVSSISSPNTAHCDISARSSLPCRAAQRRRGP